MVTEELNKWSKIGIGVPGQYEALKEFNMEKSVEMLLKRQEETERKLNV